MSRPPRPNQAALATAEKIRQLQARIEEHGRLLDYLAETVKVPGTAQPDQYRMMLEHQRDTAITVAVWLEDHALYGPTGLLVRIKASLSEPDYEPERVLGHQEPEAII